MERLGTDYDRNELLNDPCWPWSHEKMKHSAGFAAVVGQRCTTFD